LAGFNRRLFDNAGFPVNIDLIDIDVVGSTSLFQAGNVFLSASIGGLATVNMIDTAAPAPVPLPAALPMMLSGLALLGSGGLRRRFAETFLG
jgi:hypothetical protein